MIVKRIMSQNKPKLLDLFCGAGGAAAGYARAGFTVTGIDNKPQPHFPFEFIQMDFRTAELNGYDAYHASPPCQAFSICTPSEFKGSHPNFIDTVRKLFRATGKPYVIENVCGAMKEFNRPLLLCGSMFGLRVWRHRLFEIVPRLPILTPCCNHSRHPVLITGRPGRSQKEATVKIMKAAMGINWMVRRELDQAIPPEFTHFIGKHLINHLSKKE